MRIISGSLKGKKINYIKDLNTRPLKDSVRENIFNILKHSNLLGVKLEKSNILDLYSGTGSFGVECISRGAGNVTFVEKNRNTFFILDKNLTDLSIKNKSNIFNDTVEKALNKNKSKKFDIFFLDPPFLDKNLIQNLNLIKQNKMYKKKHIIVIHREKKTKDDFDTNINIMKIKTYGRSKIIFAIFN